MSTTPPEATWQGGNADLPHMPTVIDHVAVARLYGEGAAERFRRARAVVVGIGGVGSWAAELKRYAFGEDARPLDFGDDIKSISSENTFLQDTADRLKQMKAIDDLVKGFDPGLDRLPGAALLHDRHQPQDLGRNLGTGGQSLAGPGPDVGKLLGADDQRPVPALLPELVAKISLWAIHQHGNKSGGGIVFPGIGKCRAAFDPSIGH